MLSPERQREILAIGLLALALFLLLGLIPASWLGVQGEAWFPSGNIMGAVGAGLQAALFYFLGFSTLLLPALLAVGGLRTGNWVSPSWTLRLTILAAGLLVLLPPGLHVLTRGSPQGGAVQGAGLVGKGAQKAGTGLRGWFQTWAEELRAQAEVRKVRMEAPEASEGFSFGGPSTGDFPDEGEADALHEEPPESVMGAEDLEEPADGVLDYPYPRDDELPHELPPLHHLDMQDFSDQEDMERELDRLGEVLVEKLQTFNVNCSIGGRTTGPVVTQFEVVPAPGVKVNKIANLDADLALAMEAQTIRIVAPIPGKGAVGVEIPNPNPKTVLLREILEAPEFANNRAELPLALGRDLTGKPFVADLAKMPHALIAGATGTGKSVCLNSFITSLIYRHTPETLRFLLIDPKMVELSAYVDLPHLRHPVVTNPRDAASVLKWAVFEMERRYEILSQNTVRSLGEFNKKLRQGVPLRRAHPKGPEGDPDRWLWTDGPIPYVVLVVDELADLMSTVQSEVEKPLTLLAQKARAIGIHLLVATQRPSVNVITGLIKANFPSRVAFRVVSKVDSRTIIDQNGADALLGNGDMLFQPPGPYPPLRIQGAFISTEETERLTSWYRDQAALREEEASKEERWPEEEDILDVVRSLEAESSEDEGGLADDVDRDEKFWDAAEVCIQHNQGSTSLLQRRLKVGYGRAARMVDQLFEAGILGPSDGSKAREVFMTLAELEFLRRAEEEEL